MHTKNKSIRVAWIDNIKMFAMLSVMFGHISATYFSGEPYKDWVHHFLISWSMPLFIFISGYTGLSGILRIANFSDYHSYVMKISERILFPSLAYSCILEIFSLKIDHTIVAITILTLLFFMVRYKNYYEKTAYLSWAYSLGIFFLLLFNVLLGIFNQMWYFTQMLRYLILASTCCYFVKKFRRFSCFIILLAIIFAMMLKNYWYVNIELLSYFILGMCMKYYSFDDKLNKWGGNKISILLVAILLSCIAILFTRSFYFHTFYDFNVLELYKNGQLQLFYWRQLSGAFWCLAFMLLFSFISSKYTVFSSLGSKTLAIYAIHASIILVVSKYCSFRFEVSSFRAWCLVIFGTFLLLFLTVLIMTILEGNKYGRILFLGEK